MVHASLDLTPSLIDYIGEINGVHVSIKRDDGMHPMVSGNKLYKLKLNIEAELNAGNHRVLTFGGAYANHLAATAAYCNMHNLQSVGVVRGERPKTLNPTLRFCENEGMHLHFISRAEYRHKNEVPVLFELKDRFDSPYIIPEGGGNKLGIEGARQILDNRTTAFDAIVCAIGTGTTVAGLLKASQPHQHVVGVPIHKHSDVMQDVLQIDPELKSYYERLEVWDNYHFGGYAKWNEELITTMRDFHSSYGVLLDPIYTGKAMFALLDQTKAQWFNKGNHVLFIHTGGLQGIAGFEERNGFKIFPKFNTDS